MKRATVVRRVVVRNVNSEKWETAKGDREVLISRDDSGRFSGSRADITRIANNIADGR